MFINTSKIHFESKSQQITPCISGYIWCLSIRQRYILKANHNCKSVLSEPIVGVYQYVKDTFWKQITTKQAHLPQLTQVFINTSKIHFESKSQPSSCLPSLLLRCLSIRQRYILKANHNRPITNVCRSHGVYQYVKDTFWKQITTMKVPSHLVG